VPGTRTREAGLDRALAKDSVGTYRKDGQDRALSQGGYQVLAVPAEQCPRPGLPDHGYLESELSRILPCCLLPCGLLPCCLLPCGLLPCGLLPCGLLPCGLLPCGLSLGSGRSR
jgi:hypothetical protein